MLNRGGIGVSISIMGKSDFKKVRAISKLNEILKVQGICKFIIGKTHDLEERMQDYSFKGYTRMEELASCESLEEVNYLESELINYFGKRETCANVNDGGAGRLAQSDKYYVYVALKEN